MSKSQKSVGLEKSGDAWKVLVGENGSIQERTFAQKEEAERFVHAEEIRLGLRD